MGLAITFGFIAAVGFGLSAVFARLGLQRIAPMVALSSSHVFLQCLERFTMRIVWGTFLAVLGVVLVIIGSTQL